MVRARAELPASRIPLLYRSLDRQLEAVCYDSRPEVARRLLEVLSQPSPEIAEIAGVVRHDVPLAARLIRMSNAVIFGQRRQVTTVERACVVLGTARLKALVLGLTLHRADPSDPTRKLASRLWCESLLRASVASACAREITPEYADEAYVIGLMLDLGVPLMLRLRGVAYAQLVERLNDPEELYRAEYQTMPFTHVDVAAVLAARWKLPRLLGKPVEAHHGFRRGTTPPDPLQMLTGIAAYAGALQIPPGARWPADPRNPLAREAMGLGGTRMASILEAAAEDHRSTLQQYELHDDVPLSIDELIARVQQRLAASLEDAVSAAMPTGSSVLFRVGQCEVECEPPARGIATVYLRDSSGNRAAVHRFIPGEEFAASIIDALALEPEPGDDTDRLDSHLRSLAA